MLRLSPRLCLPLLALLPFPRAASAQTAPVAVQPAKPATEHVVMMVWDGLRPDSVTARNTPNLFRLAQSGVTFSRHHPVYPSSTEVNGTALATGAYPARSGIIANREYRPDIDPLASIATEDLEAVRRGDAQSPYLKMPTLAEIIQNSGSRTAIAGTKPVVLLSDRSEKRASAAAQASATVFQGQALSPATLAEVVKAQGTFPPTVKYPNTEEDSWTTRALTQTLWKTGVPKFSQLWLSDADYTQHDSSPGSPASIAALKSCDEQLGAVLAALDAKGVRGKTSIFVVSDHGFSTISRQIDLIALVQAAGFQAPRKFTAPPKTGEVLVVGLGGSALFYVGGRDRATTERLSQWLLGSDFAGVVWSRAGLPGTFGMELGHISSPGAPDLSVSFRWGAETNAFGVPGTLVAEGRRVAGQGTHASLSRFDMHNTCIASGPDFKAGFINQIPSGNLDLAPTILHLLGLSAPMRLDGRVLREALRGENFAPGVSTVKIESHAEIAGRKRSQYLVIRRVSGVDYIDEGNSGAAPAP